MKNLTLFSDHSGYQGYSASENMEYPNVSHCVEENHVHYNDGSYKTQYFTLEPLEDGLFNIFYSDTYTARYTGGTYFEYSIDGGATWERITYDENVDYVETEPIVVKEGDKIMLRGINDSLCCGFWNSGLVCCGFNLYRSVEHPEETIRFNAFGNVASLVLGENFSQISKFKVGYCCFASLFKGTGIVDASNVILPFIKLNAFKNDDDTAGKYCYASMFQDCENLIAAPKLPAKKLTDFCYSHMFYGCTSLTDAPELPATKLSDYCYDNMFNGCASLTTAPELLAETLVEGCYSNMFSTCRNINSITCLATDISADNCTAYWFYRHSESGTFKKAESMEDWTRGINGIPEGWTIENV